MGPDRIARGFALALLCCTGAAAQDAVVQRLGDDLAAARYGEALEATAELEDRALAAEWRSYLYGQAGDLSTSLREARAGLEFAPDHVGLLTRALDAALSLGLAETASELSSRLLRAAEGAGDPALLERARRLERTASELADLRDRAEQGVTRARAVALTGLCGALVALLRLARPAGGDAARA